MSSFHHQGKIRWKSACIPTSRGILIGIWVWHVIGQFSWSSDYIAVVIGFFVVVFDFFGHGFDFVDGMSDADEIAPGNAVEGVTGRANFLIYLETSSQTEIVSKCYQETNSHTSHGQKWQMDDCWAM